MLDLILPGDPGFAETLALNPPPGTPNAETGNAFVMGVDGVLRSITNNAELDEYLLGGEYAEVMRGCDWGYVDDEDENEDLLW